MQQVARCFLRTSLYPQLERASGSLAFSSSPLGGSQPDELKATFSEALTQEQKRLKALKTNHGSTELHTVNVNMVIGGMRGITGMLYETSLLDADEGIRFRGYSIPELQVSHHEQLQAHVRP